MATSVSQPKHRLLVEKDLDIPLRDGVRGTLDLFLIGIARLDHLLRQAVRASPGTDRFRVQRDECSDIGPVVADDHALAHQRVCADAVLERRWRHVLALRGHQEFLLTSGDEEESVVVDVTQSADDPTVFLVDVTVSNASAKPIRVSIVYTAPGAVARAGTNGLSLGTQAVGLR